MANELIHGSVGVALTQAEWEAVGAHVFNCQATGDMVYASSSTQLSRVGIGTAGQHLTVTCVSCDLLPTWSTVTVLTAASQAQMETGTSNCVAVTPGRQHFHPGHPKGWVQDNTNSCTPNGSYNVSGVVSGVTGQQTVSWCVDFTSDCKVAYAASSMDACTPHANISNHALGSATVQVRNDCHVLADSVYALVALGDQ